MLLDKTGLRKKEKGASKGKGKGFKSRTKKKLTQQETDALNREKGIQLALNTGIGYSQYKKEVDEIRAERIRKKMEEHGNGR